MSVGHMPAGLRATRVANKVDATTADMLFALAWIDRELLHSIGDYSGAAAARDQVEIAIRRDRRIDPDSDAAKRAVRRATEEEGRRLEQMLVDVADGDASAARGRLIARLLERGVRLRPEGGPFCLGVASEFVSKIQMARAYAGAARTRDQIEATAARIGRRSVEWEAGVPKAASPGDNDRLAATIAARLLGLPVSNCEIDWYGNGPESQARVFIPGQVQVIVDKAGARLPSPPNPDSLAEHDRLRAELAADGVRGL